MVLAFSGWNDAGEAATGALQHLLTSWQELSNENTSQIIAEMDPEDFYDFQVNRPLVFNDQEDARKILWPTTQVYVLAPAHLEHDLVIVKGVEPSMRWKAFVHELLDLADDLEVSMIITLGSLLADIPHSRAIAVNTSSTRASVAERLNVELSTYEGPTGILGVIHDGCLQRDIDSISLWVPVPHYACNAPSPKASLALIHAIEDFLRIAIPQEGLAASADAWEKAIDNLAQEDSDIADYVRRLEESKDAADIPEISGEMIAKEFERYLRRRNQD